MAEESFQLLKPLGAGGFAHTHKARVLDPDLVEEYGTEIVALKIPLDKKKERVLRREVEMNALLHRRLRELQSCNLVRYLGFETYGAKIVMVMEYVEGGSLRGRIGDIGHQKPMPIADALNVAKGVLQGLAVVHREHIFHRDIKPENILLQDGTPKISDLGISRMLASEEMASTTTGTIYYMSPEILTQEGASFTSDIWSLGVVLYELLAGKLPFGERGTPLGRMVDLIRQGNLVPVKEHRPDIPAGLEEIVTRTLDRVSSRRYASAEEMIQAIEQFERGSSEAIEKELAAINEMSGNPEMTSEMESRLRSLVNRFPRVPRVHQNLGEFYNRCQLYAKAVQAFKQGLRLDPENALLHWDLALAYQKMERKEQAVQCLEKALSLGLDASLRRYAMTLLKALQGRER